MNVDIDKVKSESIGKWPAILSHFGIAVGDGRHTCCPVCSPGDSKSDRFLFDNISGKGTWHCNQCNPHAGDGFALLMRVLNIDFLEACKEVSKIVGVVKASSYQKEKKISPEILRKMCEESRPIMQDDLVTLYLNSRGLKDLPTKLRCSMTCYEPETKQDQVAMLAIFSDKDGQAITIHRTFLTDTGAKLDIKSPKKMMPPIKKMSGGAVRLYPWERGTLGVCEGIETAIAIHEDYNLPVWSALSATLLESFEPPKNVKLVYIFGDNDKTFTGQKSAYVLANRLHLKGINVKVFIPDEEGMDFLDCRQSQYK